VLITEETFQCPSPHSKL